jgi:hypothetical protein
MSLSAARVLRAVPLLALYGCIGTFGENVHETIRQTISAGAAPAVSVKNVVGTVKIDAWAKPVVDVTATKYGRDSEDLRNILIGVRKDASGISIVTDYSGATHNGGVRYRIYVPAGASLRIENVAGAVKLTGTRGDVDVETQAGSIGVDLGRVAGSRSIDLRATTGEISLWISPESSASIDASSTVGAFSTNLPGVSEMRTNVVGSHATGTIGSGSARIRLRTATGAIAVRERAI